MSSFVISKHRPPRPFTQLTFFLFIFFLYSLILSQSVRFLLILPASMPMITIVFSLRPPRRLVPTSLRFSMLLLTDCQRPNLSPLQIMFRLSPLSLTDLLGAVNKRIINRRVKSDISHSYIIALGSFYII